MPAIHPAVHRILNFVRTFARNTRTPVSTLISQLVELSLKQRTLRVQTTTGESPDSFADIFDPKKLNETLDATLGVLKESQLVHSELRGNVLKNFQITDLHSGLRFTPINSAFVVEVKKKDEPESYPNEEITSFPLGKFGDRILVLGQYDNLSWIGYISGNYDNNIGIFPKKIADVISDVSVIDKYLKEFNDATFGRTDFEDKIKLVLPEVNVYLNATADEKVMTVLKISEMLNDTYRNLEDLGTMLTRLTDISRSISNVDKDKITTKITTLDTKYKKCDQDFYGKLTKNEITQILNDLIEEQTNTQSIKEEIIKQLLPMT